MGKLVWMPSKDWVQHANITRFIEYVNDQRSLAIQSSWELYDWSIKQIPDFWAALWDFEEVRYSRKYDKVVDDLARFPGAQWFPGAKLNFAENLLKYTDGQPAVVFRGEGQRANKITYRELRVRVARIANWLREMNVSPGDRVCAYMPNLIETIIAMLAATSMGAVWASCGAELGPSAVLDRLGQIEPKILFTADGYFYGNKVFNTLSNAQEVARGIPSIEKILVVPYVTEKPQISDAKFELYDQIVSPRSPEPPLRFEQLPFNHPIYVMFSSGTTGKPKCMVQGVGVLLAHLRDLVLHSDLKREDRITYISSPSWMMWNWLTSSLAVGATVVLYDGNPNFPDWGNMWRLVQEEGISIFGCSATYINYLRSVNAKPGLNYNLASLREISQTGSPLSAEGFEWIYREIKQDLFFASISGGTDINSGFAHGNPTLPVYAGEVGAPSFGMKISAYDEGGNPVTDQEGELVCEAPSPSMPLYFWNDDGDERYNETYFNFYRAMGKNVWRHGDYIIIHNDTHGITFLGRSDSVLKPSGVRIGTGEIYTILERFPEIADSVVVGQSWRDDQRVILFVKLSPSYRLTDDLRSRIKQALRESASPRHVPALILETPAIPYTFNMKKVESAVGNIVNGRPVANRSAISNPDSLDYFERILPELQKG